VGDAFLENRGVRGNADDPVLYHALQVAVLDVLRSRKADLSSHF
jgi:hypothetical protein